MAETIQDLLVKISIEQDEFNFPVSEIEAATNKLSELEKASQEKLVSFTEEWGNLTKKVIESTDAVEAMTLQVEADKSLQEFGQEWAKIEEQIEKTKEKISELEQEESVKKITEDLQSLKSVDITSRSVDKFIRQLDSIQRQVDRTVPKFSQEWKRLTYEIERAKTALNEFKESSEKGEYSVKKLNNARNSFLSLRRAVRLVAREVPGLESAVVSLEHAETLLTVATWNEVAAQTALKLATNPVVLGIVALTAAAAAAAYVIWKQNEAEEKAIELLKDQRKAIIDLDNAKKVSSRAKEADDLYDKTQRDIDRAKNVASELSGRQSLEQEYNQLIERRAKLLERQLETRKRITEDTRKDSLIEKEIEDSRKRQQESQAKIKAGSKLQSASQFAGPYSLLLSAAGLYATISGYQEKQKAIEEEKQVVYEKNLNTAEKSLEISKIDLRTKEDELATAKEMQANASKRVSLIDKEIEGRREVISLEEKSLETIKEKNRQAQVSLGRLGAEQELQLDYLLTLMERGGGIQALNDEQVKLFERLAGNQPGVRSETDKRFQAKGKERADRVQRALGREDLSKQESIESERVAKVRKEQEEEIRKAEKAKAQAEKEVRNLSIVIQGVAETMRTLHESTITLEREVERIKSMRGK